MLSIRPIPDTRFLAKPNERPAGIYMWCVFAPGLLAACMALFMEKIATDKYSGVKAYYSRPNTDLGEKFNEVLGLTHGVRIGETFAPQLWIFDRTLPAPIYVFLHARCCSQPGERHHQPAVSRIWRGW